MGPRAPLGVRRYGHIYLNCRATPFCSRPHPSDEAIVRSAFLMRAGASGPHWKFSKFAVPTLSENSLRHAISSRN